jgi:WD40 repeat protein
VTALRFNKSGTVLASGSKDTDIIIWDVVGEAGLYRLLGHHDQVTGVAFIDSGKKLVSCSKDSYVKVWELETQHCSQTVVGHRSPCPSLVCLYTDARSGNCLHFNFFEFLLQRGGVVYRCKPVTGAASCRLNRQ